MARTTYSQTEIDGHQYKVSDTRRSRKETRASSLIGRGKPVRETKFTPKTINAPKIQPISTHTHFQADAPVVYRRMTPSERNDQRIKNIAASVGSGAVVGGAVNNAVNRANPNARMHRGLSAQLLASHRRDLNEEEHARLRERVQAGKRSYIPFRTRILATKFKTDFNPKEARRAFTSNKRFLAAGVAGGAVVGAGKTLRDLKKPLPYEAQYSTTGMSRMRNRPLG